MVTRLRIEAVSAAMFLTAPFLGVRLSDVRILRSYLLMLAGAR